MARPVKNGYCTDILAAGHVVTFAMDKRLLDILCCPVSKSPVRLLGEPALKSLNDAIRAGDIVTVAGAPVKEPLAEGLITTDHKVIYRVQDGIPVMLPEEGIGTAQMSNFPSTS